MGIGPWPELSTEHFRRPSEQLTLLLLLCFGRASLFCDELSRRRRQLMPDFRRDQPAGEGKGHEKNRPPLPAKSDQIADADGLNATAKINAAVHDARTGRRCFAAAEICRCGAGH